MSIAVGLGTFLLGSLVLLCFLARLEGEACWRGLRIGSRSVGLPCLVLGLAVIAFMASLPFQSGQGHAEDTEELATERPFPVDMRVIESCDRPMTEPPGEKLVVLDPGSPDALGRLRSQAVVTQVAWPRLALVAVDDDCAGQLAEIPGVLGVYAESLPQAVRVDLRPEEELFVAAWEVRAHPKTRPGDRLDWDTPGFQPPDPPQ